MIRRLKRRISTERATGGWIALFVIVVALAISLGGLAVVLAYKARVAGRDLGRRVVRIEQPPSPAQIRANLDDAIRSLTVRQRRRLLDELIGAASRKQLRRLRVASLRAGAPRRVSPIAETRRPQLEPTRRPAIAHPSPAPGSRDTSPASPETRPQPSPTPAPATSPKPAAGIDAPLVPLHVCTGLIDINC